MAETGLPSQIVSDIYEEICATRVVNGVLREQLHAALKDIVGMLRHQQNELESEPFALDLSARQYVVAMVKSYLALRLRLEGIGEMMTLDLTNQANVALDAWLAGC